MYNKDNGVTRAFRNIPGSTLNFLVYSLWIIRRACASFYGQKTIFCKEGGAIRDEMDFPRAWFVIKSKPVHKAGYAADK